MLNQHWKTAEIRSLVAQVEVEGKKLPQLEVPGRTPAAISNFLGYLRESGRLNDRPLRQLKRWTAEEIRLLRERVEEGDSALDIYRSRLFEERDRSVDSISQKMRRLGLGDSKVREKAKNACRLDKEESEALTGFLLADGRNLLTKEIVRLWPLKLKPNTIRNRRRKLAVNLDWHKARGLKKPAR